METRVYEIKDPLGATRIAIEETHKDGRTKRRERRAKERKANRH